MPDVGAKSFEPFATVGRRRIVAGSNDTCGVGSELEYDVETGARTRSSVQCVVRRDFDDAPHARHGLGRYVGLRDVPGDQLVDLRLIGVLLQTIDETSGDQVGLIRYATDSDLGRRFREERINVDVDELLARTEHERLRAARSVGVHIELSRLECSGTRDLDSVSVDGQDGDRPGVLVGRCNEHDVPCARPVGNLARDTPGQPVERMLVDQVPRGIQNSEAWASLRARVVHRCEHLTVRPLRREYVHLRQTCSPAGGLFFRDSDLVHPDGAVHVDGDDRCPCRLGILDRSGRVDVVGNRCRHWHRVLAHLWLGRHVRVCGAQVTCLVVAEVGDGEEAGEQHHCEGANCANSSKCRTPGCCCANRSSTCVEIIDRDSVVRESLA